MTQREEEAVAVALGVPACAFCGRPMKRAEPRLPQMQLIGGKWYQTVADEEFAPWCRECKILLKDLRSPWPSRENL